MMLSRLRIATALACAGLFVACGLAAQPPTPDIRATIQAAAETSFPTATAVSQPAQGQRAQPPADAVVATAQALRDGTAPSSSALDGRRPTLGLHSVFGEGVPVRVTRVVAADTLDVTFEDGSTGRVLLVGADAPSTYSPNHSYEFGNIENIACLDEWGAMARETAEQALVGARTRIVMDPLAGGTGIHGLVLGYIRVGGQDFNAMLIAEGLARVTTKWDTTRADRYRELERKARAKGLGLWGCES